MNEIGDIRYTAVVNGEDQHSLWTEGRPLPAGWAEVGFTGTRDECLAEIDRIWPDILPRSVRDALSPCPLPPPSSPLSSLPSPSKPGGG
ncbi:MbtH family NRPS accessory protein [Phytoactinopolyspora limicola]|uniref:MbtH family NRPS accessory protein n=1 Tax=Phytoactinopolyspora limicola TaxID=2715536 RepID=UPI00140BA4B7